MAGLSLATLSIGSSASVARSQQLDNIGLQLFTVDSLLRQDFSGTLEKIAEIGYREVEFSTGGGMHGRTAYEVRDLLSELGLRCPQGRVRPKLPPNFMEMPREEVMKIYMELAHPRHLLNNLERMLEEAGVMAYNSIVLPAVHPSSFSNLKALEDMAALFNRAGELCSSAGMQFGYHNHDFDFLPVDGVVPFDYLIENTDPATVTFQLDFYWATKAGVDAAAHPGRFPGRISSCHMKDMGSGGEIVDVGSGSIDFASCTRAAWDHGARSFFVEHDNTQAPLQTAQNSYAHLAEMRF